MNNRVEAHIPQKMRELALDFVDYSENILFEQVWRDPALPSRESNLSLITLSALISIGNTISIHALTWSATSAYL